MLPEPLRPKAKVEPEIKSLILGFGHRARSGKDTAVATIVERRGSQYPGHLSSDYKGPFYDARAYSFARALKEEVTAAALNAGGMDRLCNPEMEFYQENGNFIKLPEWVVFEPDAPMDDPLCPLGKQRTLLQWWGTEFRRNVNPNYWVDRLAEIISKEQPQVALISDMRFPNEKEFVEKHGYSIRVDRNNLPSLSGSAGVHASELALADVPDWDWGAILKNYSTLEEFKAKAVKLFDSLAS
jgi:hypothetical protein